MNRYDFQSLANLRVKEARALLDNECFEGAYYLAGYAVECALKAWIAKLTGLYDFPPDRNTVSRIYSHDLATLLREAGLNQIQQERVRASRTFGDYWEIVTRWTEATRYEPSISRRDAAELYLAVTDEEDGVLSWLSQWW